MVKIMIVEDQAMVRDALKLSLSKREDFSVVASLADAALAQLYCERTRPDVILMDVCTENDSSGLEAAAQIKAKYPEVKIIVMTGLPEVTFLDRAREASVEGFIYKDTGIAELERMICGVLEGKTFFPRPHAEALNFDELTRREREVLRLICDGLSRKEISEKLDITINSVKTHFSNILSKTGYESVAKLAIYAVSHGFINTKIRS